MAILGYSQLVESQLSAEDRGYRFAAEIRKAGEHALALTQQLLAFSRRQAPSPQTETSPAGARPELGDQQGE